MAREITTHRVPSLRARLTLATTSTSSPYEVYSAGGMLLPSDIPEGTYGLPKNQFIAAIQADASMGRTETCTVRVAQGDGAPTFTLLKMGVYD